MSHQNKLTVENATNDFHFAYEAKRPLIQKQLEDFEFRLGKQWTAKDEADLNRKGVLPVTDNRIQSNISLLTGIERQNRSDIRAFPEGEEDSIKADIATALLKNVMKVSDGDFKHSEQFEDGVTCGESTTELFLDSTFNFLNPRPKWGKSSFDQIYPEPGWREFDFSDCDYVYKWTRGLKKGDLTSLYPEKEAMIEKIEHGVIRPQMRVAEGDHIQFRDYPKTSSVFLENKRKSEFDLLERYYKKWMKRVFVVDRVKQTINLITNEDEDDKRSDKEIAKAFIKEARKANPETVDQFAIIEKKIPEIWVFAFTGNSSEPLANERAWFFPRWKGYPFMNFFSRWNNAPLSKTDQHLNVQGIVRMLKSTQLLHNKAETLKLRHLNSVANSGWLTEEDAWVDRTKVEAFGSVPGINLEYKRGRTKPERITPMGASGGHELISRDTTAAIKAQLGIDSENIAIQASGGPESGRALTIRERRGIIMIQKDFDNYSRMKKNAGRFVVSQFNEIFDIESVKKVLGEAYLARTFGRIVPDPENPEQQIRQINEKVMNTTILEVLNDTEMGRYDVSIGESVGSETKKLADFELLRAFAREFPGIVTPKVILEESTMPPATKDRILAGIQSERQETILNSPVVSASVAQGEELGGDQGGLPV